jgi:hypothetical protein
MLSATEAIRTLVPLDVDDPAESEPGPPDLRVQLESVARSVGRLGRQQLQANQRAELLADELRRSLDEARERGDEHRRENARLTDEARRRARALLDIIDTLDDLAALVRGRGDAVWLQHLERLTNKTLQAFGRAGLAEIDAAGTFHEEEHWRPSRPRRGRNGCRLWRWRAGDSAWTGSSCGARRSSPPCKESA